MTIMFEQQHPHEASLGQDSSGAAEVIAVDARMAELGINRNAERPITAPDSIMGGHDDDVQRWHETSPRQGRPSSQASRVVRAGGVGGPMNSRPRGPPSQQLRKHTTAERAALEREFTELKLVADLRRVNRAAGVSTSISDSAHELAAKIRKQGPHGLIPLLVSAEDVVEGRSSMIMQGGSSPTTSPDTTTTAWEQTASPTRSLMLERTKAKGSPTKLREEALSSRSSHLPALARAASSYSAPDGVAGAACSPGARSAPGGFAAAPGLLSPGLRRSAVSAADDAAPTAADVTTPLVIASDDADVAGAAAGLPVDVSADHGLIPSSTTPPPAAAKQPPSTQHEGFYNGLRRSVSAASVSAASYLAEQAKQSEHERHVHDGPPAPPSHALVLSRVIASAEMLTLTLAAAATEVRTLRARSWLARSNVDPLPLSPTAPAHTYTHVHRRSHRVPHTRVHAPTPVPVPVCHPHVPGLTNTPPSAHAAAHTHGAAHTHAAQQASASSTSKGVETARLETVRATLEGLRAVQAECRYQQHLAEAQTKRLASQRDDAERRNAHLRHELSQLRAKLSQSNVRHSLGRAALNSSLKDLKAAESSKYEQMGREIEDLTTRLEVSAWPR